MVFSYQSAKKVNISNFSTTDETQISTLTHYQYGELVQGVFPSQIVNVTGTNYMLSRVGEDNVWSFPSGRRFWAGCRERPQAIEFYLSGTLVASETPHSNITWHGFGEQLVVFPLYEGSIDAFDTIVFRECKGANVYDIGYTSESTAGGIDNWEQANAFKSNPFKSASVAGNKIGALQNELDTYGGKSSDELKKEGYDSGYTDGINSNPTSSDNPMWALIGNGFTAVSSALQTPLIGQITLGGFLAVPLMGLVLMFLLKVIKGNS